MDKRIFIERVKRGGVRRIDRKRDLILDQKIVARRVSVRNSRPVSSASRPGYWKNLDPVRSQNLSTKRSVGPVGFGGAVGRFLLNKRRTLLWVSLFLMVFASFIPLYINLQSFVWEKRRSVQNEKEPLYDLFLDQSGFDFAERGANAPAWTSQGDIPGSLPGGMGGAGDLNTVSLPSVPSLKVSEYTVRPGDSLFGIAAKFGVPVDGIISASDLKNARYIQPGMVLRVPRMKGIMYKVKRGDNLSSIAVRYGARVNDIADINDLSGETIRPGQELFVPGASLSEWERAIALGTFFKMPARGRLTSKVGFRIDPFTGKMAYHAGIDISGRVGTPVRAAQYGRVWFVGDYGGYGKTVIIVHPDGYRTLYAHLNRILVQKGQAVKLDEKIGSIGNTGRSTGPHLHFEIHRYNTIVDPLKMTKTR
jgi:murein DD-endopeptidase MepM/ murein hydrolase activator NlpD